MICVVLGTRPDTIKMKPVIKALEKCGLKYFLVHSGQHYSRNMDLIFFEELDIEEPKYRLDSFHQNMPGSQTAAILCGVEEIYTKEQPELVLVNGDSNTSFASALASRKLKIPVAHVESGLRSYDWRMPEEHNRVMMDHISDILFAPTELARKNLIDDNVRGIIHVTGNPIVDAVMQNIGTSSKISTILHSLSIQPFEYILITTHREEIVDDELSLKTIFMLLQNINEKFPYVQIFPVHPRTAKRIHEFGISPPSDIVMIEPVGYFDFLSLEAHAKLIITDSGGVQEEACTLKTPCITIRDNTERPETVEVGANIVTGLHIPTVMEAIDKMLLSNRQWSNPLGDGNAAKMIASICALWLSE